MEGILTPHGPDSREYCTTYPRPPPPNSCLCEDTYLTNKHNYLIKRGSVVQNNNIERNKKHKNMDFVIKEDILTPHGCYEIDYCSVSARLKCQF